MKFNLRNLRNLGIWTVVFVGMFFLFETIKVSDGKQTNVVPYSEFAQKLVEQDQIKDITIKGRTIMGTLKDGQSFSTYAPNDPRLIEKLNERNIKFEVVPMDHEGSFFLQLLYWMPLVILMTMLYFLFRGIQSSGNKALGFGRLKPRTVGEKHVSVTFEDVAGIDEAQDELAEIVEFLRNPEKFQRLGGRIPRGVLLVGPPGNGKTLLARAIAGEAGVMFFAVSGSDFVEMFVGVGASRVRDMFEQAKKNAPCIIFVDEIDAVGRKRHYGFAGGHEEREQTLNQLLVEMDGFEQNQGIIMIGATNRVDILDNALLRPGRFDRQITVGYPDINGREKILRVHTRNVPIEEDIDLRVIARGTPGFSGADLANLVNEAALRAARHNRTSVTQDDFEQAKDKMLMGTERRSWLLSPEEKEKVAYHESGHAVVALFTPGADPIHKLTIIPRGSALGMLVQVPERDQLLVGKDELLAEIMVTMGGRAAEELIYGVDKVTTGASNDIEQATAYVRRMVMEWGLSSKAIPTFQNYNTFDETGMHKKYEFSEKTRQWIDDEIESILTTCYQKVQALIREKRDVLDHLVQALLQRETLSVDEVKHVVEHGTLA